MLNLINLRVGVVLVYQRNEIFERSAKYIQSDVGSFMQGCQEYVILV